MTRLDLIDRLAARFPDFTLKDIESVIRTIFSSLEDSILLDRRVEIRGFGSFSVSQRKSRTARNPKSGDVVSLSDRKVPVFRAGKELRERVNVSK
ncbi:integration host factor subunit beta [Candidatus Kinetoplastibacterium desouzaii TCC079E]|uniref:Integration host factor subunit beta n=1 Tax=Candidatus Kinetoplastidibacterium desouzai TCC079E TaxID=1208919 RepID=M1LUI7_9PROT|nr:HU family DNA-binding protein [Candidatus Kinetoplastibacterium desouzaii]AGF46974.1 integration host factor subunit beta [Candidatus Kinetoplastibacterium desouzaii TCC079E]